MGWADLTDDIMINLDICRRLTTRQLYLEKCLYFKASFSKMYQNDGDLTELGSPLISNRHYGKPAVRARLISGRRIHVDVAPIHLPVFGRTTKQV